MESREAAATIYDKAEAGHSTVGEQFIANLNREAKAQRVLWPAWLRTRAEALASIELHIAKAEAHVQALVDANDAARSA